jgi:hypothetical protein
MQVRPRVDISQHGWDGGEHALLQPKLFNAYGGDERRANTDAFVGC